MNSEEIRKHLEMMEKTHVNLDQSLMLIKNIHSWIESNKDHLEKTSIEFRKDLHKRQSDFENYYKRGILEDLINKLMVLYIEMLPERTRRTGAASEIDSATREQAIHDGNALKQVIQDLPQIREISANLDSFLSQFKEMKALISNNRDYLEKLARLKRFLEQSDHLLLLNDIREKQHEALLRIQGVESRNGELRLLESRIGESINLANESKKGLDALDGQLSQLKQSNAAWFASIENLMEKRYTESTDSIRIIKQSVSENAKGDNDLKEQVTDLKTGISELWSTIRKNATIQDIKGFGNEVTDLRSRMFEMQESIEQIEKQLASRESNPQGKTGISEWWSKIRNNATIPDDKGFWNEVTDLRSRILEMEGSIEQIKKQLVSRESNPPSPDLQPSMPVHVRIEDIDYWIREQIKMIRAGGIHTYYRPSPDYDTAAHEKARTIANFYLLLGKLDRKDLTYNDLKRECKRIMQALPRMTPGRVLKMLFLHESGPKDGIDQELINILEGSEYNKFKNILAYVQQKKYNSIQSGLGVIKNALSEFFKAIYCLFYTHQPNLKNASKHINKFLKDYGSNDPNNLRFSSYLLQYYIARTSKDNELRKQKLEELFDNYGLLMGKPQSTLLTNQGKYLEDRID